MTPATLTLDAESVAPESLSMAALTRELNLHQKPHWMLVKLMNALERQRQEKGMGWSRAWNKYGLRVFRTHVLDLETDAAYVAHLDLLLTQYSESAPANYRSFLADLLSDPQRMIFTFYHNHTALSGEQYEGLTISMGRKTIDDPSKRDRIDLILEDRRVDGAVDGKVDRVRMYVCPWFAYGKDRSYFLREDTSLPEADQTMIQSFYRQSIDQYNLWKEDSARQWSHWSVRYIDYFGPREFIPKGSSFI